MKIEKKFNVQFTFTKEIKQDLDLNWEDKNAKYPCLDNYP